MGGIKVNVHPLFFAFGIYYALTGKIFIFLIATLCAVVHETGHSICAGNRGYRLDKITLMPFGAVVSGEIDGLKSKDEIAIALAGPLVNLGVAVLFVAGWWIYPQTYAYTDVIVSTCFSLAVINLIPAYPLDGGRVLYSLLRVKIGNQKAKTVCSLLGVALGICLVVGFILTCFNTPNYSLLFFSAFVLMGNVKVDGGKYVRLFGRTGYSNLSRGVPYKKQGIDANSTVKTLLKILDEESLNEIVVFRNGKEVATLSQKRITDLLQKSTVYDKIGEVLGV